MPDADHSVGEARRDRPRDQVPLLGGLLADLRSRDPGLRPRGLDNPRPSGEGDQSEACSAIATSGSSRVRRRLRDGRLGGDHGARPSRRGDDGLGLRGRRSLGLPVRSLGAGRGPRRSAGGPGRGDPAARARIAAGRHRGRRCSPSSMRPARARPDGRPRRRLRPDRPRSSRSCPPLAGKRGSRRPTDTSRRPANRLRRRTGARRTPVRARRPGARDAGGRRDFGVVVAGAHAADPPEPAGRPGESSLARATASPTCSGTRVLSLVMTVAFTSLLSCRRSG